MLVDRVVEVNRWGMSWVKVVVVVVVVLVVVVDV